MGPILKELLSGIIWWWGDYLDILIYYWQGISILPYLLLKSGVVKLGWIPWPPFFLCSFPATSWWNFL